MFADSFVVLRKCKACKTFFIEHQSLMSGVKVEDDWADPFYKCNSRISSLMLTRRRQASLILKKLRKLSPLQSTVCDYGCGLGIFLQGALRTGFQNVIGIDMSFIALEHIRNILPSVAVFQSVEKAFQSGFHKPEEIDALVALDVVEHLPYSKVAQFPLLLGFSCKPRVIVVKVPISSGILFNTALLLAKIGFARLLHQMLQVGDSSPHVLYFSQAGLVSLLGKSGYDCECIIPDLDYEPFAFSARLDIRQVFSPFLDVFLMPTVAVITRALGLHDTVIGFFVESCQRDSGKPLDLSAPR